MDNIILIYVILINIIGFLSMYIDKKKAVSHKWRTKESTLMLIALLGGGIGSFAGMRCFRHKTKHLKFTLGIPVIILIEIFIILYFYTK